jgi:hypothetical protein
MLLAAGIAPRAQDTVHTPGLAASSFPQCLIRPDAAYFRTNIGSDLACR